MKRVSVLGLLHTKKGCFLSGLNKKHKNEMLGEHFTGSRRVVSGW